MEVSVLRHRNFFEQLLDKGQFGSLTDRHLFRIEVDVLTECQGKLKVAVALK